jgi:hypothetical protein
MINLSIVNLAAVPDGSNDDRVTLDVENDAPVTDPQSHSRPPLETLYVTLPRLRERRKLGIKPLSHVAREMEPLAGGRGRKHNLHLGS